MDLADRFTEVLIGAGLEIDEEHLLVGGRALAGVGDGLAAGRIDGNGFGEIDMFAGVHGVGGLLRMEIRGRLDDYGVELAIEQALIAGQAGVTAGRGDLVLLGCGVGFVLEIVGAGNQAVLARLGEKVGNPTATTSAADESDVEGGVGFRAKDQGRSDDGKGGGSGCAGQEGAAGNSRGAVFHEGIVEGIIAKSSAGCGPKSRGQKGLYVWQPKSARLFIANQQSCLKQPDELGSN